MNNVQYLKLRRALSKWHEEKKDKLYAIAVDEDWDDLKLNEALQDLYQAYQDKSHDIYVRFLGKNDEEE